LIKNSQPFVKNVKKPQAAGGGVDSHCRLRRLEDLCRIRWFIDQWKRSCLNPWVQL